MKNQNCNLMILLLLLLNASKSVAADIPRLKSMSFDKSRVEKVMVTPGLATVLTFPCDIDEVIVGRDQDVKAIVSATIKSQLTLYLSSSSSQATNLLVRCGDKKDLFVFDVIPSRKLHQDVVKVSSYFGFPVEIEGLKPIRVSQSPAEQDEYIRKIIRSKVVSVKDKSKW